MFTMIAIAYGSRTVSDGWLELRVDPSSATVVKGVTGSELARALSKLSREQRRTGIKIEADATAPQPIADRCKSGR
jgi:hypothetical protein